MRYGSSLALSHSGMLKSDSTTPPYAFVGAYAVMGFYVWNATQPFFTLDSMVTDVNYQLGTITVTEEETFYFMGQNYTVNSNVTEVATFESPSPFPAYGPGDLNLLNQGEAPPNLDTSVISTSQAVEVPAGTFTTDMVHLQSTTTSVSDMIQYTTDSVLWVDSYTGVLVKATNVYVSSISPTTTTTSTISSSLTMELESTNVPTNSPGSAWNPQRDFYSFLNYGVFNDGGDCYGFSSTAILYFMHYSLGHQNYPYYPEIASSLSELQGQTDTDTLVQSTFPIYIHQHYDPGNFVLWSQIDENSQAEKLEASINGGAPAVIGMTGPPGGLGHAVVAWGYTLSPNGDLTIDISDSDEGNIPMKAYLTNGQFSYNDGYSWTRFWLTSSPEMIQWSWFSPSQQASSVKTDKLNQYYNYVVSDVPITIEGTGSSSGQASFSEPGDSLTFDSTMQGVVGFEEGNLQVYAIPHDASYTIKDPGESSSRIMVILPKNDSWSVGYQLEIVSSAPVGMNLVPGDTTFNVTTSTSISMSIAFFSTSANRYSVLNATSIPLASQGTASFNVPDWNNLGGPQSSPTVSFYRPESNQTIGTYILSNGTQSFPSTMTSSSAQTTSSNSGGIPEFPPQSSIALIVAVIITVTYLVTRRSLSRR